MDRGDKQAILAALGVVLSFSALILLFVWLLSATVRPVAEEVEQHGLESIVNEIWCGKDGCDE